MNPSVRKLDTLKNKCDQALYKCKEIERRSNQLLRENEKVYERGSILVLVYWGRYLVPPP
jgi:hypothetical protein